MNDIIYMLEDDRKAEGEDDDSDDWFLWVFWICYGFIFDKRVLYKVV